MGSEPAKDWRAILSRHHQEHVFKHLAGLDASLRAALERELSQLDFELLDELVASIGRPAQAPPAAGLKPPATVRKGADPGRDAAMEGIGRDLLAAGKVACVLVAGGQGSRLKHAGPKGTYPATPVRRKTLFELFAEKLRARARSSGRPITLCVMTSEENHAETVAYFRDRRFLGLDEGRVLFFMQGMLPAVDGEGRLVLRAPGALYLSPNGHGGTLLALRSSGILDGLSAEGVEELFYFQVDNPLVDVCDPVFLGYHRDRRSDFSSKVVAKDGPDEKVGVIAEQGGRLTLIEYSDMPPALRQARAPDGSLLYSAGNIATHALRLGFVRKLTEGRLRLPFHMARKTLEVVDARGARHEVAGIKFETFVFDALSEAERPVALEVRREDEFAPIKNAAGADSPATSTALQSASCARMLEAAGVMVPRDGSGQPRVPIEISPLFAASADELRKRRLPPISFDVAVYLGDA